MITAKSIHVPKFSATHTKSSSSPKATVMCAGAFFIDINTYIITEAMMNIREVKIF